MKRMTPATRLILDTLKRKYEYFSKRNMLAADGSFYCLDKYLMDQLGIGDNTIRRARIFLKEAGEINYLIGKHKGAPTRYWVTPKDAKMASTQSSKEAKMEPSTQGTKGANLSAKEANLAIKASQIGTLDNKSVIKAENKEEPNISSLSEEVKEGMKSFAKLYGIDRTVKMFTDKGYSLEPIQQIFTSVEECRI
jgi:hypothetical protein